MLRKEGLALPGLEPGGNGEGKEEADVLAGALHKPKGSLCLVLDMRRMEPGEALGQPTANREYTAPSTANLLVLSSNRQCAVELGGIALQTYLAPRRFACR